MHSNCNLFTDYFLVLQLKFLVKTFNYASQRKASIPTIGTWLNSLRLDRLRDQLFAYGAVELVDLADIDDNQFREMRLTKLQSKHWQIGMNQILAARREAMADGKADLSTFRGHIESWRLMRLMPQLVAMGATVQQDLLYDTHTVYTYTKIYICILSNVFIFLKIFLGTWTLKSTRC